VYQRPQAPNPGLTPEIKSYHVKKLYMTEAKTKPTEVSVDSFLGKVSDESVRADCQTLIKLMHKVTGLPPVMWGPSIIGFGKYHYKYESGHEGDICQIGFSPRKQNISLYVLSGFKGQDNLLKKLGECKSGKGCLYIKKLKDVDLAILEQIMTQTILFLKNKFQKKGTE
jgi:Domain of unknown function (DU1801)